MLLLHNHHCHTATMLTQPARGPVSHARPVQNEPKVQTAKRCARQLRIFLLSAVFAGSLHVTSTARYRRAAVALSFCSLSLAASLPLFLTGGPRHLFAAISGHQLPWVHQGRYDLVSWLVLWCCCAQLTPSPTTQSSHRHTTLLIGGCSLHR